MNQIILAYIRALRSLAQPKIFWHLLWPTILAIAIWVGVATFFWAQAVAGMTFVVQSAPWLHDWLMESASANFAIAFLVQIFLIVLIVPLVFVTSAILVAAFALPLMLDQVAQRDYADLQEKRGGSLWGSIANAIWSLIPFLLVLVFSLPLWLVPGVGVFLSIALSAWLNQRCYRYDALMNHADLKEMRQMWRDKRIGMYVLGLGSGALAYVPFINLFVPAFTGLAFVHYLLQALRQKRLMGI